MTVYGVSSRFVQGQALRRPSAQVQKRQPAKTLKKMSSASTGTVVRSGAVTGSSTAAQTRTAQPRVSASHAGYANNVRGGNAAVLNNPAATARRIAAAPVTAPRQRTSPAPAARAGAAQMPRQGAQVRSTTATLPRAGAGVVYPDRRRTGAVSQQRPLIGVGSWMGPKAHVYRERVKYETLKAPKERRMVIPFAFIFTTLIVVSIIAYLLMLYVHMNENDSTIIKLQNQIAHEQQEKVRQESIRNSREDIRFIEEQAIALGMVKKETLPRQYVSVVSEDKIEVLGDEEDKSANVITSLADKVDQVKEYFPG